MSKWDRHIGAPLEFKAKTSAGEEDVFYLSIKNKDAPKLFEVAQRMSKGDVDMMAAMNVIVGCLKNENQEVSEETLKEFATANFFPLSDLVFKTSNLGMSKDKLSKVKELQERVREAKASSKQ